MPTMRDPSLLVYFRPESGGLIMGGYERHCAPWSLDGIPADFNGKLLEEDWPRFEELMENAVVRVPSLEEMEVVRLDQRPRGVHTGRRVHPRPDRTSAGFWVAAGFCAHGLAGAGGMGKLVAEWIVEGTPVARRLAHGLAPLRRGLPLARVHARPHEGDLRDVLRREVPGARAEAGRPLRVSAAYPRLAELGAVFGEKSGWERANWFEPNAAAGDESLRPRGWAGKLWSPAIGAEHVACRETAALFDESSFAKIEVSGTGAADFPRGPLREPRRTRRRPRHVHADAQPRAAGSSATSPSRGSATERFRIVTGTAFGQHDLGVDPPARARTTARCTSST